MLLFLTIKIMLLFVLGEMKTSLLATAGYDL